MNLRLYFNAAAVCRSRKRWLCLPGMRQNVQTERGRECTGQRVLARSTGATGYEFISCARQRPRASLYGAFSATTTTTTAATATERQLWTSLVIHSHIPLAIIFFSIIIGTARAGMQHQLHSLPTHSGCAARFGCQSQDYRE
jgi:hypothetical protein